MPGSKKARQNDRPKKSYAQSHGYLSAGKRQDRDHCDKSERSSCNGRENDYSRQELTALHCQTSGILAYITKEDCSQKIVRRNLLPNMQRETAVTPASSKSVPAAATLQRWRLSSWYNEINTQTDAETCIRFFFAVRSFILHKSKSKRFRNPNQKGLQTKTAVLCKKGVDI